MKLLMFLLTSPQHLISQMVITTNTKQGTMPMGDSLDVPIIQKMYLQFEIEDSDMKQVTYWYCRNLETQVSTMKIIVNMRSQNRICLCRWTIFSKMNLGLVMFISFSSYFMPSSISSPSSFAFARMVSLLASCISTSLWLFGRWALPVRFTRMLLTTRQVSKTCMTRCWISVSTSVWQWLWLSLRQQQTQQVKQKNVAQEKNRHEKKPRMGQYSHRQALERLTKISLKLASHSVSLKSINFSQISTALNLSSLGWASGPCSFESSSKQAIRISQYQTVRKEMAIRQKSSAIMSWNFVKMFLRQALEDSRMTRPRIYWYWMIVDMRGMAWTWSQMMGNLRNSKAQRSRIYTVRSLRNIIHMRWRARQAGRLLGRTMWTHSTARDHITMMAEITENSSLMRITSTSKCEAQGISLQYTIVTMFRPFSRIARQRDGMVMELRVSMWQMREVQVHSWTVIVAETSRGTKLKQRGSKLQKQVIPMMLRKSSICWLTCSPDSTRMLHPQRISRKMSNKITKYFQWRCRKEGTPGLVLLPFTTNSSTITTKQIWNTLTVRSENQKNTSRTRMKELRSQIALSSRVMLMPASKFLLTTAIRQILSRMLIGRVACSLARKVITETDTNMRQKAQRGVLSDCRSSRQKQMGISRQLGVKRVNGMSRNKLMTSPCPSCSLHVTSVSWSEKLKTLRLRQFSISGMCRCSDERWWFLFRTNWWREDSWVSDLIRRCMSSLCCSLLIQGFRISSFDLFRFYSYSVSPFLDYSSSLSFFSSSFISMQTPSEFGRSSDWLGSFDLPSSRNSCPIEQLRMVPIQLVRQITIQNQSDQSQGLLVKTVRVKKAQTEERRLENIVRARMTGRALSEQAMRSRNRRMRAMA